MASMEYPYAAKTALRDMVIINVVGAIIFFVFGVIGMWVYSPLVLSYILYSAYRPTGRLKHVDTEIQEGKY